MTKIYTRGKQFSTYFTWLVPVGVLEFISSLLWFGAQNCLSMALYNDHFWSGPGFNNILYLLLSQIATYHVPVWDPTVAATVTPCLNGCYVVHTTLMGIPIHPLKHSRSLEYVSLQATTLPQFFPLQLT